LSDIPIVILGFIMSIAIAMMALKYIYRTQFPMSFIWFMTGAILLVIFITTDTISLGQLAIAQNYDNATDTIYNTYEPDTFPIKVYDNDTEAYTQEPTFTGIMLIVLSLSFIMVGVLIEKYNGVVG